MSEPSQYQGLYNQPPDPESEKARTAENQMQRITGRYGTVGGSSSAHPTSPFHDQDERFSMTTDPKSRERINEFVQVNFEDIIQEQEGTDSLEQCKPINSTVYTFTKNFWYTFLATLTGILLSIGWGLAFATMAYFINWIWSPAMQIIKIAIYMWATIYRYCVRAFLDPLYESVSKSFSNIHVSFHTKTPLYHCPPVTQA